MPAGIAGKITCAIGLEYHGQWSIDLASIERAIGSRTKALLVVNPNNPTGNFISKEELSAIAREV